MFQVNEGHFILYKELHKIRGVNFANPYFAWYKENKLPYLFRRFHFRLALMKIYLCHT